MINGINFWSVDIIKSVCNLTEFIKEINHIWNGHAPNFIINENKTSPSNILFEKTRLHIEKNKKNVEDILWIKKYFIVFSSIMFALNLIIGKKPSIFISRETHSINLDLDLSDIRILAHKNEIKPIIGVKIIFIEDFSYL